MLDVEAIMKLSSGWLFPMAAGLCFEERPAQFLSREDIRYGLGCGWLNSCSLPARTCSYSSGLHIACRCMFCWWCRDASRQGSLQPHLYSAAIICTACTGMAAATCTPSCMHHVPDILPPIAATRVVGRGHGQGSKWGRGAPQ